MEYGLWVFQKCAQELQVTKFKCYTKMYRADHNFRVTFFLCNLGFPYTFLGILRVHKVLLCIWFPWAPPVLALTTTTALLETHVD